MRISVTSIVRCILFISLLSAIGDGVVATPYEVKDSFGKHWFDNPPERVVVTDWTVLENLLELGITPMGAPEIEAYQYYVRQPQLPEGITDIGLRHSPDLATVKKLDPDVVILGTQQRQLARPFSIFTRVNYFNYFSSRYRTNGDKSRLRFLQIAKMMQKEAVAKEKLNYLDQRTAELRQQLAIHFSSALPRITTCRISAKEGKVLLYGNNSMPQYSLIQLGIEGEFTGQSSTWGETEVDLSELKTINHGFLICFKPHNNSKTFASSEWKDLPLVKEGRFLEAEPAWSYGGAMSVLYIAESIVKTLETVQYKTEEHR